MTAHEYLMSLEHEEREAFLDCLATWLGEYTDEVARSVVPRLDKLVNDPTSLNLVRELHERTQAEHEHHRRGIESMIRDYEGFAQFGIHNHVLEHAGAYRNVLYDMYIR